MIKDSDQLNKNIMEVIEKEPHFRIQRMTLRGRPKQTKPKQTVNKPLTKEKQSN